MGQACGRRTEETEANKEIQQHLNAQHKTDEKVMKLLLLGSGSSGKSTIFKQLKCIHSWGLESHEFAEARHTIRSSLVQGIIKLCRKSHEFYNSDPNEYKMCHINENDAKTTECIDLIVRFGQESFEYLDHIDWTQLKNLANAVEYLWKLDPIQNTFNLRGTNFAFKDNMEYFYDRVQIIFDENFEPTHEDVLKCKVLTTGMFEHSFEIKSCYFNIYDVGGQRNERKKWIHSFQGVTAVIFVAALNHYNAVLFEDENKNAMHESIELFGAICNSKWFRRTAMILFLNKHDLFIELLMNEVSLAVCFGRQNRDWASKGKRFWVGPDYRKNKEKPQEDAQFFEFCKNESEEFIKACYWDAQDKQDGIKKIYTHITTATDRNNIEKVFWDVQNIVIRINLSKGGFVYSGLDPSTGTLGGGGPFN